MKKFLGEEHLNRAIKSLLLKMNADGSLKVDKTSISAKLSEGVKIAEIAGVSIYAPEGVTPEEIDQIKQELVDEISNKLSLSGGSMSGTINMQNNRVTGLPYTQYNTDAVSLSQMRNEISSYIVFTSNNSFTLQVTNNIKAWDGTIEYSTDAVNWHTWSGGTVSSANNKIYLRGSGNTYVTAAQYNFYPWVLTGSLIQCSGNLESILDYKSVEKGLHPKMSASAFRSLFKNCTALSGAPYLGSLNVELYGYKQMFQGCTSLVVAPELPATVLHDECYSYMFSGCTSLKYAPELPATNLGSLISCYSFMFNGCRSLVNSPHVLPARAVGAMCYADMFSGCTALTSTPKILATSVGVRSFEGMFDNCTSLKSPLTVRLPATALAENCYCRMFRGCTSLVDVPFDLLPATTLANGCYFSMFEGCTALTTPPALPATTLTKDCYYEMFRGCTSLEVLPVLFATVLPEACYEYMFNGCTSIKFSSTQVGNYVGSYRVPASGTGTAGSNSLDMMIEGTGGTAQSISINTTLYTSNSKLYPNGLVENPDGSVTWLTHTPLDNTPTQGSLNGVTSDGIYQAIQQGGGGASALVDLTDVAINNVSDGQGITYDSASQKWKNVNMPQEGTVVQVLSTGIPIAVIDGITIYAPDPNA